MWDVQVGESRVPRAIRTMERFSISYNTLVRGGFRFSDCNSALRALFALMLGAKVKAKIIYQT